MAELLEGFGGEGHEVINPLESRRSQARLYLTESLLLIVGDFMSCFRWTVCLLALRVSYSE